MSNHYGAGRGTNQEEGQGKGYRGKTPRSGLSQIQDQ